MINDNFITLQLTSGKQLKFTQVMNSHTLTRYFAAKSNGSSLFEKALGETLTTIDSSGIVLT
jgi:hypothetical protein